MTSPFRFLILLLIAAALGASSLPARATAQAPSAQTAESRRPEANPADVASLDAIIAALYDVISGPAGQARDWDRMRSLFVPGARLIPVRVHPVEGTSAVILGVEDYIRQSGPFLERNGFFEHEIGRTDQQYGHIAHVFSAYAARRQADDPQPFMRGINSIQAMHDGARWWIVTVYWDQERPATPIPEQYLRPAGTSGGGSPR